jgi:glutamate-1-semialdehyde 2,1-aminomutase
LADGIFRAAEETGINIRQTRVGTMTATFFTDHDVFDWDSVKQADSKLFASYFHLMLENGIYLPPSQFEAMFLSSAHDPAIIDMTIKAAKNAFNRLGNTAGL